MEGHRRIILCAPTGAGKTVMFSETARSGIEKGSKALIVTDRVQLLTQSGGALNAAGLFPEQIDAGSTPNLLAPLHTAMVETLHRRMGDGRYRRLLASKDIVIFDEAHKQSFNKLFPHVRDDAVVIGATATPYRDGSQSGLDEFYTKIVTAAGISGLITQGYLAKPLTFGVPTSIEWSRIGTRSGDYDTAAMAAEYKRRRVWGGVIENYRRVADGKKTLVFASNVESAADIASRFADAGYPAKCLDYTMPRAEQEETVRWYRSTPGAILCNVAILTTGFDAPETECIILYRATKSLPLFLQMCGRGSRVATSKASFAILDFGDNVARHGFWEQDRVWKLEKEVRKRGTKDAYPVKNCPACAALLAATARSCSYCGEAITRTAQEDAEERVASLSLLTPFERRREASSATLEERAEMAKAGLIKPYWVMHNLTSLEQGKAFAALMGWNWNGWWYHNRHRFPNLK